MKNNITIYTIGEPFPEDRYISSFDRVVIRVTLHSFDVIITLDSLTPEERKALVCDKFYVSIFAHKQIPHIVFDFGSNKFNVTLNIQKINSVNKQDWVYDNATLVNLFVLEPNSGNIVNFRKVDFPLMKELRCLLRLQLALPSDVIDARAAEAEQIYSVQEMENYSIFYGEVPESGILIDDNDTDDYIF